MVQNLQFRFLVEGYCETLKVSKLICNTLLHVAPYVMRLLERD